MFYGIEISASPLPVSGWVEWVRLFARGTRTYLDKLRIPTVWRKNFTFRRPSNKLAGAVAVKRIEIQGQRHWRREISPVTRFPPESSMRPSAHRHSSPRHPNYQGQQRINLLARASMICDANLFTKHLCGARERETQQQSARVHSLI